MMMHIMPAVAGVETFIVDGEDNDYLLNKIIRAMNQPIKLTIEEMKQRFGSVVDYEAPDFKVIFFDKQFDRYEVIAKTANIEDIVAAVEPGHGLDIEYDNFFVTYRDRKWSVFSKDMHYRRIVSMILEGKFSFTFNG